MHIKDLAERAGVTVKAVRYYESRGLISPERATNGYRTYDDEDVRVVREVRALLSLGLTAEQTHPFVECLRAGNDRADVCPASLSASSLKGRPSNSCGRKPITLVTRSEMRVMVRSGSVSHTQSEVRRTMSSKRSWARASSDCSSIELSRGSMRPANPVWRPWRSVKGT